MNPSVLLTRRFRFRKELIVVGVTLISILALPVVAVASMTSIPALAADSALKLFTGERSKDNLYDFGFCTFWVSKRRAEVGFPIPQNWGDAHSWDDNAFLTGYKVDHAPQQYAIMQTDAGDLGHVAFVEEVGTDGSWKVSEMNVKGWDILSDRTFKPSQAKDYNFIH
jgi:surface antigen